MVKKLHSEADVADMEKACCRRLASSGIGGDVELFSWAAREWEGRANDDSGYWWWTI
jgi:hypothetical protein